MAQPPNTINGNTSTNDQIQITTAGQPPIQTTPAGQPQIQTTPAGQPQIQTTPAGQSERSLADVTMASLSQQIDTINATLEAVRTQRGLPTTAPGSLPEISRLNGAERYRPHILKPNKFSHTQGENFLAWRAQFQAIAVYNRWSDDEAKTVALAHMVGLALEAIIDINAKNPLESLESFLDQYQNRFLPKSESQVLRTQFNYIVQLPTESVQKLHSRLRVLYHLAYPNPKDRSEITLVERYIQALNNRVVQSHVRRRKPQTYSDALDCAQEETSFVLLDNLTHAPGGPQQPQPSDTSFVGAIRGRPALRGGANRTTPSGRQCFYCGEVGHMKEKCPIRLRDLLRSKGMFRNQKFRGSRGASSATGSRPPPGNANKRWVPADAKSVPPTTTEGYGAHQPSRRISTIEEHQDEEELPQVGESLDVLDELDFNTLDEATIAALYEEIRDIPIEMPRQEESDFPEGQ